jgi:hypothetical protein
MKKLFRITLGILSLLAIVLVATGIMSYTDIVDFVKEDGIVYGMATAAGEASSETVTTEVANEKSPELLVDDISKKITMIKPSQVPLDTILRDIGTTTPSKAWKTDFYEVDVRGVVDTLKKAFDTSSSGTYESSTGVHTITVTSPHIWTVDDNILFQGYSGLDDQPLVAHIVGKNAVTGTLSVMPLNGIGDDENDMPDMAISTPITRIGTSKSELDASTTPYANFPQKLYNYNQIHMAQIEESFIEKLHNKEVKWDMHDIQAQSIYDMRRMMEYTSIFGVRKKLYNPIDEDYIYHSGGIISYIDKSIEYTEGGITNDSFVDMTKQIFVGNAGSDTRILFAGSNYLSDLQKAGTVQKQIDAGKVVIKWGVKFTEIETIYGYLLLKHHQLLDDAGWGKKGLVLDISNLEKHNLLPMKTTKLEYDKTGIKKANAVRIDEAFCLVTRYADTHAILEPAATS